LALREPPAAGTFAARATLPRRLAQQRACDVECERALAEAGRPVQQPAVRPVLAVAQPPASCFALPGQRLAVHRGRDGLAHSKSRIAASCARTISIGSLPSTMRKRAGSALARSK